MQLIKIMEKYPLPSIVCFTLLITMPWLNEVIVSLMEARNFITAREMLTKGNWFLTTLNELPRYEKPPLPTWLTAFSGYLFGIQHTWALRFPAIGMLILLGSYVYFFSLRFVDRAHSFRNALIALTSFYILAIIIEAPWDIYTHAFMLVAIVHLMRFLASNQKKDALWAAIFIGCSVLSKGPIALYALLLPFVISYPIVFGMKNNFLLKVLVPLLLGILIGSVWFIYVRIADPEAFLEIAATETSNWSHYQTKPFYYYWSFFVQSGIWAIVSFMGLLYPYMIKRVTNKKAYQLSFLWTLIALILLSVIPEKKTRYLMPVLIPLAINTGFYIQYLHEQFSSFRSRAESFPVYLNFGLPGILAIVIPVAAFFFLKAETEVMPLNYIFGSALLIPCGILLFRYLIKKNMQLVFYMSIVFFAGILVFWVPLLAPMQNQNEVFAPITGLKEEAAKQNINIYLLDEISPEMLWDYGSSVPFVEEKEGRYIFPKDEKFGLLVNNKDKLLSSEAVNLFDIEEVATYNRNVLKQSARRHRTRNICHYYVLAVKGKE